MSTAVYLVLVLALLIGLALVLVHHHAKTPAFDDLGRRRLGTIPVGPRVGAAAREGAFGRPSARDVDPAAGDRQERRRGR